MNQEIWNKTLGPNEELKYEFTIGERYQKLGVIIGIILGLPVFSFSPSMGIIMILSFFFYFGWYLKKANVYAFTNKRVLVHRGWLNTQLISIDYDKITDISVAEPFLNKIITKTGNLFINTAGTSHHEVILEHIEEPYEKKKKLDEIREIR